MSALDVFAAVEAGARAMAQDARAAFAVRTWDQMQFSVQDSYRERATRIVTAAFAAVQPQIDAAVAQARAEGAREALREAAKVLEADDALPGVDPYGHVREWLTDRADGVAR